MKKSFLLAGAVCMAIGTAAQAATFSLVGGVSGSIPDSTETNEVLTNVFGMTATSGFFGSRVDLTAAADITVKYFGYEAGFSNSFSITGTNSASDPTAKTVTYTTETIPTTPGQPTTKPGRELYATGPGSPLNTDTLFAGSGMLDFLFTTSGNAADAVNGSNPDNSTPNEPNFFTAITSDKTTVFLFFDDTGADDDDNHDDFVVSLTITNGGGPEIPTPPPVPLPAGGLLLIGGLGALAAVRRRKHNA